MQAECRIAALDLRGQQIRREVTVVAAHLREVEVVFQQHGVGRHTCVEEVFAADGDAEPVITVGLHVEIRRVVLAEIDPVKQHAVLLVESTDQQVGGAGRSVPGISLPRIGDRGDRALAVRQQVAGSGGREAVAAHSVAVHIVLGVVRRGEVTGEERRARRDRGGLHGVKFDLGNLYRDVVGDFRHGTFDFESRSLHRTAGCGGDRHLALAVHRKCVVIVAVRDRTVGKRSVASQIDGHAQHVISGQTLEAQRRRSRIAVQHDTSLRGAEVEVHVTDRPLVRRTAHLGDARHSDRCRDLHRAGLRFGRKELLAAAVAGQQHGERREDHKQFFHSRIRIKMPARASRQKRSLGPQFDLLRRGRLPVGDGDREVAVQTRKARDGRRDAVVAVTQNLSGGLARQARSDTSPPNGRPSSCRCRPDRRWRRSPTARGCPRRALPVSYR